MSDFRLRRRGFTLLEMTCVMAVMVVIAGMLIFLLREVIDLESTLHKSFDGAIQQEALASQFRADVAAAESAPASWQDYKAGPDLLILRSSDSRHVVYLWRDGKLQRQAVDGGKKIVTELQPGSRSIALEFAHADKAPAVIRLKLIRLVNGKALPDQTLEIAAALGGDLR